LGTLAQRLLLPYLMIVTALVVATSGLQYHPRPGYGWLHQLTIWVVVLLSAGGSLIAYRRLHSAPDDPSTRLFLVLGAVPLVALALVVEPFDSLDLGGYLNNGRLPVVYGLNPYVTSVENVPGWSTDTLLLDNWKDTVCAYGFLFARLAAAVVAAAGEDRAATYMLFKLLNVVALALTVWLVDRGCRQAGVSRSLGIFLVAWNPLVLLHGISNGHNDLLAGLGLIAALVAARGSLWWAVMPALAATALIKYSTVPVIPLALLYLVHRHGWLRAVASALLAAALVVLVSMPYVQDGAALEASRNLANVTRFLNSLGSLIVIPVQAAAKKIPGTAGLESVVVPAVKWAGGVLVLGTVGWLARRRWLDGDYSGEQFVRDVVLVQFLMIVVASAKFFGWYLLMFWPTVTLLPEASRLRRSAIAVAFAQMGSFTFLGRSHIVSPLMLIALPLIRVCKPEPRLERFTILPWLRARLAPRA
jgi:hypothetical protein